MQKERVNVAISAHTNSLRLIQEYLEGLNPKEVVQLEHHPEKYKKYVLEFKSDFWDKFI
jgi:bisphosphoglycerate-dependent phosphoglycerate mutase